LYRFRKFPEFYNSEEGMHLEDSRVSSKGNYEMVRH
jgi:hypothetical protein